MRPATLTPLLLIAFHFTTTAQQFSVLPQVGLENSRTSLKYNKEACFSPLGATLSPHLGVRMSYAFKQGHGPFVGIATSRSAVAFQFANPETGMSDYKASPDKLGMQFQGGYQVSTKPIYFKSLGNKPATVRTQKSTSKKSCGGYARRSCGKSASEKTAAASANKGWFVRVQPSIGAALMSAAQPGINILTQGSSTLYQYQAGNWNTALMTGAAFEFGKNLDSRFTVTINYLKGIGNLSPGTIETSTGGKSVTTTLESNVSSWYLTAGIPILLGKKETIDQKDAGTCLQELRKKEQL